MEIAKVFTDGGARGNPGPAAFGLVIFDEFDKAIKISGKYIGISTNNRAEYLGLLEALKIAQRLNIKEIICFLDSELIVRQLNGEYKVKDKNLKVIYKQILTYLKSFEKVSFSHKAREENKLADSIVNIILDAAEKIS